MDAERLLLAKAVKHADLRPITEAKITSEFFYDEEHREAFKWILEYHSRWGKVPGLAAVQMQFPGYELKNGPEPYEFYLDEVKRRRQYELTFSMLVEASALLEEDDADAALDVLQAQLLKLHTEVTELRDTNLTETWQARLERYEEWRNYSGRLRGIPSGFPTLDHVLRGFQEQQLITFVGSPKTGKSTLLMRMALEAHLAGYEPLFIGFEMGNEEQEARHDAMRAGVSYPLLLSGNLPIEQRERLARELKRMKEMHPFVLSADPEGTTVGGIAAKIDQYRPHIVFVDGVYMMDDENGEPKGSPQALTNITRSLKKLAMRTHTPLVISTQALLWKMGKNGLHGGAIGYSSSFLQDSDVIMGVEHTGDEDDPIKKVSVLEARSAPRASVLISWDWERGSFTELKSEDATGSWSLDEQGGDPDDRPDDTDDGSDPEPKRRRLVRHVTPRDDTGSA